MKKNKKRLKLTKLTISNLDRLKGGYFLCACDVNLNNGAWNRDHHQTEETCLICP